MTPRPSVSRDRWLVSYADFMTLLCAFFTTLYASSLVSPPTAAAVPPPRPAPVVERPVAAPAAPPAAAADPLAALRDRLSAALDDEIVAGRLQLVDDRRGLVVEVPEAAAFAPGQATLTPTARAMMRRIGSALADLPHPVRVEGHTDDAPIRTPRFASNWELSTARATDVVALFVHEAGLAASRLSAAGYGEHRPRAANDSAAGRLRNRRVDIVVLNPAAAREEPDDLEAPR
ncbi:MAG: flagellar motor protein MotB [Vicinamibacterales bacterium]